MNHNLIDARFKHNALFSYGSQLLSIGAGFVTVTLITRYAGIETYGVIATMVAISEILSNLMTFRTNEAVVTFYKQGEVNNTPGLCRLSLLAGLSLDMVMGLMLFIFIQLLSPVIADSLLKDSNLHSGVAIFSGIMLAKFLRGTPFGLLVAEERFRFINSLNLTEQVLKMSLIGFMLFQGIDLNFENIIWSMLLPALLVTSIVYLLPLIKLVGPLRKATLPRDRWPDYVRFTLNTFLSTTLKAGNQNIDTVLLGYFTNPINVGIYNLFRQFLSPMAMLSAPFSSQITPQFVRAVTEKRPEDVRTAISYANQLLMRGFILMLLVIVPIVIIYNRWNNLDFTLEYYIAFGLMIVSSFFVQRLWWGRPFSIAVDAKITLIANIISMFITIISVSILTRILGLVGCAMGMMLNYISVVAYYKHSLRTIT